MKAKDIIYLIIGIVLLIAGVFLISDFLKTFLPFVAGMILIIIALILIFREWR